MTHETKAIVMASTLTTLSLAIPVALLVACTPPDGLNVKTPVFDMETVHTPEKFDKDGCAVRGELRLPKGAALTCGEESPESVDEKPNPVAFPPDPPTPGPSPAEIDPLPGDSAPSASEPAKPDPQVDSPPPAAGGRQSGAFGPLRDAVVRTEGGKNSIYCDPAGLHIGDGIKIFVTDSERDALLCERLEEAHRQAERILGSFTWSELDEVRRDAWAWVCYAASCAKFRDAIYYTQVRNYKLAAEAVLDSKCPTCLYTINPERAEEMADWLETGERP